MSFYHGLPMARTSRPRTITGRMNLVGEQVKILREREGLTQDQLCARIADVTQGAWNPTWRDLYRIEAGTRIVSDLEMIALGGALTCEAASLMMEQGSASTPAERASKLFMPGDSD